MKSKTYFLSLFCVLLCNFAIAQSLKFETKKIEIFKEDKLLIAEEGKAISIDGDVIINADKFEYQEDIGFLKAYGNGKAQILSKNLEMKFEILNFDQKKNTIDTSGEVEIIETNKQLIIKTINVFFDIKNNIISSNFKTTLKDNRRNLFEASKFFFEVDKDLLKLENLRFEDENKNILKTEIAFVKTSSGKIFGKDINIDFNNINFNEENEPRLKANSAIIDKNFSELNKGVFTTCKKKDDCPPWQISAKKVKHDKSKKIINYEDAVLKLYDLPVMYFPKFFHPDPTVIRQSGFLIPSFQNSNNNKSFLNTPYFFAISENKDATFNPRFYKNNDFLFQTEYRQANYNSNHIADFGFFDQQNKNKNHFFYNYKKEIFNQNYETNFNVKVEQTSDDTYLKANNIKSEIINDYNTLENSIGLDIYSDNLSVNINANIYENLNKNGNDRYEYIMPNISLNKYLENQTNLKGDFNLKSQVALKNYNTNVYEKTNINDLIFRSYPTISLGAFYNNFEFLVKNSNTDNKNYKYKNGENIYLSSIFQYNSSLPLIKENLYSQSILKPKISFKIAPTHTEDRNNEEKIINATNVYNINRLSENTIEGGLSVTYGADYSLINSNKKNKVLDVKIANNLRLKENNDLPNINQMNEKNSNIFSEVSFSPNEYITAKLNNSIKNNLNDIANENLVTEFKINNLVSKFDYFNENNTTSQTSFISNETTLSVDKFNNFSFATRKNKTKNLTEYYKLIYQYKNDCLAASIEYNKNYYTDRELKPNKNLLFKLSLIPFGEIGSPNIKN